MIFGRPFVKRLALCYQTVVCLFCPVFCPVLSVCLSVTFVHCGQTVGRIKMKLGTQVGLSPGHTVLHGDPGPPPSKPQRGTAPNFRPISFVALGRKVGLDPRDIVLDGDPAPLPQKGPERLIFGSGLLWPNGCMDQDATLYGGRPRCHIVVDGDPAPLPKKGTQPPNFQPMFVVAKRLDVSRCH